MSLAKTSSLVVLFLCATMSVGCGYLDDDLWVDDQTFEEELYLEGLSISGSGSGWGCGGARAYYRHRHGRLSIGPRSVGLALGAYGTVSRGGMTDEQILESTDIEMVDETADEPAVVGSVEEVIYDAKDRRDTAVVHYYAGE